MENEDYYIFIDSLAKKEKIEKEEVDSIAQIFNISYKIVIKDLEAKRLKFILATRATQYLN